MTDDQAIRLTVRTTVGPYDVTLSVDAVRQVLRRFGVQVDVDELDAATLASYLRLVWLKNAVKADAGQPGTMEPPYLNYETDRGELVTVRSTAVIAVEAKLVPVEKGMGFGSITTELPGGMPPNVVKFPRS